MSNLIDLEIGELRKMAAAYKIPYERTWKKPDFVRAIDAARRDNVVVSVVDDEDKDGIPQGHVRIKVIPMAGLQSNYPVPVTINNYKCHVPMDVVVDAPKEVLEALNHASRPKTIKVKDPEDASRPLSEIKDVPLYNVQVLGVGPKGPALDKSGKPKVRGGLAEHKASVRAKFREVYKRWPKHKEEKQFADYLMRQQLGKTESGFDREMEEAAAEETED